jgi:TPR repeat protein
VKEAVYEDVGCRSGSASACLSQAAELINGRHRPASHRKAFELLLPIVECLTRLAEVNLLPASAPNRLMPGLLLPEVRASDPSEYSLIAYQAGFGDAAAELDMADVYYLGELGKGIDFARARALFERHPNNVNALVRLGHMWHLGEGVPVDLDRAEQYYRRAVEMDSPEAMNNLGVLMGQRGRREESQRLIARAADAGNDNAVFNMAAAKVDKGEIRATIPSLTYLAEKDMLLAQHLLARVLLFSGEKYDPHAAWRWIRAALDHGPWRRTGRIAEEYWRQGNRAAAVILWMQLADAGCPTAAFNAGIALLDCEFDFMGEVEQKKLASTMLKKFATRGTGKVAWELFRAYAARGKMEKAAKALGAASAPEEFYRVAEAHLDGRFQFRVGPIIRNLSLAIQASSQFRIHVIVMAPRLMWAVTKQTWKCCTRSCSPDESQDLREVFLSFFKQSSSDIAALLALSVLVIFVRKRVALLYR